MDKHLIFPGVGRIVLVANFDCSFKFHTPYISQSNPFGSGFDWAIHWV